MFGSVDLQSEHRSTSLLTLSGKKMCGHPPVGGGGPTGPKCAPAQTGVPPQLITTHVSDSGSTVTIRQADALRTSLLISTGYDWTVTSSNPAVLALTQRTTGPDPVNLSGTDRILVWRPQGYAGTVTLSGQLLPTSGSGAAIATFTLTVNIVCSGSTGIVKPHTMLAGKRYVVDVYSSSTAPVPTLAAAQAALPSAAQVQDISNPISHAGIGLRDTSTIRMLIVPTATVGVTNAMLVAASGIANPVKVTVQALP